MRIRHRNPERIRKAHQPRALARREPAGIFVLATADQNLRAILVVARREGPRDILLSHQTEAEAVSRQPVLFRIGLQVTPQVVAQKILVAHLRLVANGVMLFRYFRTVLRMQDCHQSLHGFFGELHAVEIEAVWLAESGDQNPLPVLRNEVLPVDDAVLHMVAKLFPQRAQDDVEGAALVVRAQVLYVLQQKGLGLLGRDDPRHVEEQRSLRFVGESMTAPERVLFGDAGDGKRLTGKARQQYIVIGNFRRFNLRNVAGD